MNFFSPIRIARTLLAVFALSIVSSLSAQGVFLTFSGGNGSPVTVTWSTPITYAVTFTSPNSGVNPYFVFQAVPNSQAAFPVQGGVAGSAPTYSGTGVGSNDGVQTINSFHAVTTDAQNAAQAGDLMFSSFNDTANTILTAGDVITLSAGSLTYSPPSNGPYFGALPANGFYSTIIVDAAYVNVGHSVTSVPEPSTYAAIAGVGVLGLAVWRRRGKS